MAYVFLFLSAACNLATAVFVPVLFILGEATFNRFGLSIPLADWAVWGMVAYGMLNAYAAKGRPGGEIYFHIDLWPSLLAFLSIGATTLLVFGADFNKAFVVMIDHWFEILVGLVVLAFIDIFYNQRANAQEMWARVTNRRRAAAGQQTSVFKNYDSDSELLGEALLGRGDIRQRVILEPFVDWGRGDLVRLTRSRTIEHHPSEPPASGLEDDAARAAAT